MTSFKIVPQIKNCDSFDDFLAEYKLCQKDLILTDRFLLDTYIFPKNLPCAVIAQDDFGGGEPTSEKVKKILEQARKYDYNRVIAIGGGTAIDISKILVLSGIQNLFNLFTGKEAPCRERELIIIPTTCGTGSEITNISIVAFEEEGTKLGLANDSIYADTAVLIPEFLENLPYKVFMFSSVDALIHAVESYLSPLASVQSDFFAKEAIKIILSAYLHIEKNGKDSKKDVAKDVLTASNYAGIAFSNAGCGLIHAMSYPLSGEYHIPHGEANYMMLAPILNFYGKRAPGGRFDSLKIFFKNCGVADVNSLISKLIEIKPLSSYGADKNTLITFAEQVIKSQQRLLARSYVLPGETEMVGIYNKIL
ncbi:MAG: 4-hydroxybutyrate dehydrogenase [Clostridiales bacterium]|nr:MAG: 4-hydroxybutyrate dehydrogenase [Clostridiales bacterium]